MPRLPIGDGPMTPAERQKRRRDRLTERREAASAGNTDAELAQAVRDLHIRMQFEAPQGDGQGKVLLGGTPAETLANVIREAAGWKPNA